MSYDHTISRDDFRDDDEWNNAQVLGRELYFCEWAQLGTLAQLRIYNIVTEATLVNEKYVLEDRLAEQAKEYQDKALF